MHIAAWLGFQSYSASRDPKPCLSCTLTVISWSCRHLECLGTKLTCSGLDSSRSQPGFSSKAGQGSPHSGARGDGDDVALGRVQRHPHAVPEAPHLAQQSLVMA